MKWTFNQPWNKQKWKWKQKWKRRCFDLSMTCYISCSSLNDTAIHCIFLTSFLKNVDGILSRSRSEIKEYENFVIRILQFHTWNKKEFPFCVVQYLKSMKIANMFSLPNMMMMISFMLWENLRNVQIFLRNFNMNYLIYIWLICWFACILPIFSVRNLFFNKKLWYSIWCVVQLFIISAFMDKWSRNVIVQKWNCFLLSSIKCTGVTCVKLNDESI